MKTLSKPSRLIIAVTSLALISAYFVPVWFIYLMAPQYPEGLTMHIWLYKLSGQVEIINGLNHYIGMKPIKAEMFPELKFLVYVLAFFICLGLTVAIVGKRSWLFALIILSILGGALSMYDFYQWGYDYGHNLDPTAAIQIPGFSYQPPLIGHKTLLNFDAYSYPDTGGWIIIIVALIYVLVWGYEFLRSRKARKHTPVIEKKSMAPIAALLVIGLASCSNEPRAFNYGRDICEGCHMTIMDNKFGAQVVTKKGRMYLFDDAHCLADFLKAATVKESEIGKIVFVDYENQNAFLDAKAAVFLQSPVLKSPMNSNAAAFASRAAAEKYSTRIPGKILSWPDLLKSL